MKQFRRRAWALFFLSWAQRASRLLLRALWLAGGAYLLWWSLAQRGIALPGVPYIYLLFALPALLALLAIVIPVPRPSRLLWRLDRHYGFQEQLSAAWQTSTVEAPGEMARLLAGDAAALLPRTARGVFWRGWFITRDLVSLLTIAVLFLLIFGTSWAVERTELPAYTVLRLPPSGDDPTPAEVVPGGIPGVIPPDIAAEADVLAAENGDARVLSEEMQAILQELGSKLGENSASYAASEALQEGDLLGAADALEALADRLDSLGDESRQEMSEAFAEAGQKLEEVAPPEEQEVGVQEDEDAASRDPGAEGGGEEGAGGQEGEEASGAEAGAGQKLGEEMKKLAERIGEGGDLAAREQMDRVAERMRQTGRSTPTDGEGSANAGGGPSQGDSLPLERFGQEGESLTLGEESAQSGLLRPGVSDRQGAGQAGGAYNSPSVAGGTVSNGVLAPAQYPWVLRDVVSSYFSPEAADGR